MNKNYYRDLIGYFLFKKDNFLLILSFSLFVLFTVLNDINYLFSACCSFMAGVSGVFLLQKYHIAKKHIDDKYQLKKTIENIFWHARSERSGFQDGMDSLFSINLKNVITEFGNDALVIIRDIVDKEESPYEVIGEGLRWIGGRLPNNIAYEERCLFLEHCLKSKYKLIRDGAILGIETTDDPRFIPAIEEAIIVEDVPFLKTVFQQVLEDLKEINKTQ